MTIEGMTLGFLMDCMDSTIGDTVENYYRQYATNEDTQGRVAPSVRELDGDEIVDTVMAWGQLRIMIGDNSPDVHQRFIQLTEDGGGKGQWNKLSLIIRGAIAERTGGKVRERLFNHGNSESVCFNMDSKGILRIDTINSEYRAGGVWVVGRDSRDNICMELEIKVGASKEDMKMMVTAVLEDYDEAISE